MDLRNPFATLQGQAAVVTGGARGIGFGVAQALLGVGMHVLILDRDADALNEALPELSRLGPTVAVTCDLSRDDDLPALEAALDRLPQLALWMNNAGGVSHQRAEDVDMAHFDAIMQNNASSAVRGGKVAFRRMSPHRTGSIVNVGSVSVDKVMDVRLTYAASKAAVLSITRYQAQDWGASGIRVNAISPGFIDTRLTTSWADDDPRQLVKLETMARIAARRTGQPDDIARAVLFLASDLAAYVTGEILHVDGGWHLV